MFSGLIDILYLAVYLFMLFGIPIVFLIATLISVKRKNVKPAYVAILIISLSFSIGYILLSRWVINGYVNEDYRRAVVDVLKVSDDGSKCFYLAQPHRGMYYEDSILHVANKKTDKKIVLAEGVIDIFITNDNNFI